MITTKEYRDFAENIPISVLVSVPQVMVRMQRYLKLVPNRK